MQKIATNGERLYFTFELGILFVKVQAQREDELYNKDPNKSKKVMDAILKMYKIDIHALKTRMIKTSSNF